MPSCTVTVLLAVKLMIIRADFSGLEWHIAFFQPSRNVGLGKNYFSYLIGFKIKTNEVRYAGGQAPAYPATLTGTK